MMQRPDTLGDAKELADKADQMLMWQRRGLPTSSSYQRGG